MTIALFAEISPLPGQETHVEELLARFAERVRQEPGNLLFEAHRIIGAEPSVFVYESYRDDDAFQTHLSSEHGHEFNALLGPLVAGGGSRLTMLAPLTSTTTT
jgi:quinol monooxygenase YgiN